MKASRAATAASIVVFLLSALARPAAASGPTGTASLAGGTTYRGVSKTFQFTIKDKSTTRVGSVQITRPSKDWTITGCPGTPSGWTVAQTASHCRFNSAAGKADNLRKGVASPDFLVSAQTAAADVNTSGPWKVKLDKHDTFKRKDAGTAKPASAGSLGSTAYVWQILDAVVADAAPAVGSACPAASKTAGPSATKVIAICGASHAADALTPVAGQSSLGGTFIDGAGTFGSGSIPSNASGTVLATYSGAQVASSAGTGKTVVAKIGSAPRATSPRTTLDGYVVVNDVTPPTTGTVNDGPPPTDLDVQRARTTMNSFWTGFSDTESGIASYDYNLSTTSSCAGDVVSTQNKGLLTAATDTALALNGDQVYFNCVRATDAFGNTSSFAPSDGILIKPLNFNPPTVTLSLTQSSADSFLQNLGDTTCNLTYSQTDSTDFDVTGPSVLASNATGTVTVSQKGALFLTKSTTVTANGANCGTATLTAND